MEYTGERFVPSNDLMNDETAFEHLHRYYHVFEIVKGKVVLDIGCGEGYGSSYLATNAKTVYGVDIDNSCIEHAKKKYACENLQFIQGDVTGIPLANNSVDVVVSFETIEHLSEEIQPLFLNEIKRVLIKEGMLIISTPDKTNYSDRYAYENKFHVKEFTKQEFHAFLSSYFETIADLGQRYEIVDAITPEHVLDFPVATILNWQRDVKSFVSKYLLSICCDGPIKKELLRPSVVFQVSKDYWQLTDRASEMESQILELGAWGRRLDKEMAEKNAWLDKIRDALDNKNEVIEMFSKKFQETTDKMIELQTRLMEQSEWVRKFHYELVEKNQLLHQKEQELDRLYLERNIWSKGDEQVKRELKAAIEAKNELEANAEVFRKQVERLQKNINELHELKVSAEDELNKKDLVITQQSDTIRSLSQNNEQHNNALKKRDVEIEDKKKIIAEQKHQIDDLYVQLQMVNQRLAEIYQSEGWKVLSAYYNIKGKLLPENSKRYARLKSIVNRLRGKKENPVNFNAVRNRQVLADADKAAELEPIEFPVFESPSVSIVMPAYNGWALTYRCLASIKKNTFDVAYEIIIGDDASTDETKDIDEYVKNILVIRNERNLEFLHNCNHAASFARGKYILFLNNDTEVCARWLSSMVDLLEKDDTVGMVGSKLIYPNGKLQEAGGIIWSDASGWNFGHNQDPDAPEFNYVKEVDYISGASIIIRTDLWKHIGGFDKRYTPAYCEDSDLAFEVRSRGYKVMYQPLSEVIHFEGYTHGTDQSEGIKGNAIKAYQKRNNEKFREKWEQVLRNEHFANGENVFWARDKSRNKKTILVIDHYVPEFDKDAGSKTVFQYLKLFVSLNFNVKFIGDNFYRHEPYTTVLQQLGIEVLYGADYAANWQQWILSNHDKFDYVLLNRPHVSAKYIDFIKHNTNAIILYYGHDLHFVRLTRQFDIERRRELLEEAAKWKKIEISLFNKADIILAPSEKERDLIKGLGTQQHVISLPPYVFDRLAELPNDFSERKDIFFIGGFTHTPNKDAVLWYTKEVWPMVKAAIPAAKFIIAGSNAPPEILALASDDVDVIGFISDEALQKLYNKVRVAVIPLRYGAGVKGKTVEAMYHGIPLVSTECGMEGLPRGIDFLSPKNDAAGFAREVIRLYNDSNEHCLHLSRKEIQYVNDHFYFETVRSKLCDIISVASNQEIGVHSKSKNSLFQDEF